MNHVLRGIEPDDFAFVKRRWAGEMRHAPWSRGVPGSVYWGSQYKTIEALLLQSSTILAVDPADSQHLYGVIVFHRAQVRAILHWLFVKAEYRKLGLAKALLAAAFGDARPLHLTQVTTFVAEHPELCERSGIIPSPFILLGTHVEDTHARDSQAVH